MKTDTIAVLQAINEDLLIEMEAAHKDASRPDNPDWKQTFGIAEGISKAMTRINTEIGERIEALTETEA